MHAEAIAVSSSGHNARTLCTASSPARRWLSTRIGYSCATPSRVKPNARVMPCTSENATVSAAMPASAALAIGSADSSSELKLRYASNSSAMKPTVEMRPIQSAWCRVCAPTTTLK